MAGKGSKPRKVNKKLYDQNFDYIFRRKNRRKKKNKKNSEIVYNKA